MKLKTVRTQEQEREMYRFQSLQENISKVDAAYIEEKERLRISESTSDLREQDRQRGRTALPMATDEMGQTAGFGGSEQKATAETSKAIKDEQELLRKKRHMSRSRTCSASTATLIPV